MRNSKLAQLEVPGTRVRYVGKNRPEISNQKVYVVRPCSEQDLTLGTWISAENDRLDLWCVGPQDLEAIS